MDIQEATGESSIPPGLSIIHSNHMEDLRRVATQWICAHPLKPLENEAFIVQSNGMAQWLKLALAENDGCGISAALDFQLPARFLWRAYRAVLGAEAIPLESPYDKKRLVWRLLRLAPSLLDKDWCRPLRRYLADDHDMRKRYQLACQLADLYDQYQVYRADWLEDWTAGRDQLRNAAGDPAPLPREHRWQAEFWRRIRADVPEPHRDTSRSNVHVRFLKAAERLRRRPEDLPRRVIVFGISSLPGQALEALHAVSRHGQVLIFVHNPCRHYWADIIEDRELLRIENARHGRKSSAMKDLDPERLHQHVNPLLAAWGRQARDFIGLLYGYDQPEEYRRRFAEIDLFGDAAASDQPASLLQQVQQAVLDLAPLPDMDEPKRIASPGDQSISFQDAHSRQREVEILHDQLLSFFDRTPDLKPQDIIVMTPDIDAYGPHIEAVFGNLQPDDPRHIPFTIADRPEQPAVPMVKALEKLLHLPGSRMAVSDLMDLLEAPAFRERFGLNEVDLAKLYPWIQGAGVRWGLNAEQRREFDLPAGMEQNTWLFGLRRMLLGYAVGDGAPWRTIEPYDEIGGLEAALAGALAMMLERLERYWRLLGRPAAPREWGERILGLMNDFFLPMTSYDQLTRSRMEEILEQWLNACEEARLKDALTLQVVREALLGAMENAGVSQRFLAGRVNFCTMMPMRAIPFKVVCLLGMNDGEYPRAVSPLDFDLMAGPGRCRPGDRSRREDDRYLFFEALLSAREKFYVSYIGRSVRDNSQRVPSVLAAQLRDYLAAGWRTTDPAAAGEESADPLLDQLTRRHPLQPFSKTYFQPETPDLFSYAHEWRQIFHRSESRTAEERLDPPKYEGSPQLDPLIRFLKNPIKCFFKQRLKVFFDETDRAADNHEPFTLDGRASYDLVQLLFDAALAASPDKQGDAVTRAAERLRRTGELPLNGLGELSAEELVAPVQRMLEHHHELGVEWTHETESVEIRLPVQLPECAAEVLEDWLDGLRGPVHRPKTSPLSPPYARWEDYPLNIMNKKGMVSRFRSLIGLWVKHLAGCAQGLVLSSYLVAPDGVAEAPPLEQKTARQWLTDIIEHWWEGLRLPLPVTARTALSYLGQLPPIKETVDRQKAKNEARRAYEGDGWRSSGELGFGDAFYLKRSHPDFDALWHAHGNRFETLARALYAPLVNTVSKRI